MVRVTEIKLLDRLLLIGPPGIGKTEVIRQKAESEARELNKIFVDLREANDQLIEDIFKNPGKYYVYLRVVAPHIFPEDLGIPRERSQYVEFLPPKMLKVLTLPDIYGVLFIDEITNVQRDDQISMYYSLILEKEAGFQLKLSRNIKIILAGNPPEWSEIVRPLPKPLRNRMIIVEVSAPTVDEWIMYMERVYGDRWEKLCGAYLKVYPKDLINPPQNDFDNYPTPRSWTQLAVKLYELKRGNTSEELIEEVVIGSIGKEVGAKFLTLYRTKIDIKSALEELERRPERFDEYDTSAKILVASALSQRPVEELKKKYSKLLEHLMNKHREFLAVVIIMMTKEKKREFATAFPEIVRKLAKNMADYITI
jgi:MoxR-like ATPase